MTSLASYALGREGSFEQSRIISYEIDSGRELLCPSTSNKLLYVPDERAEASNSSPQFTQCASQRGGSRTGMAFFARS